MDIKLHFMPLPPGEVNYQSARLSIVSDVFASGSPRVVLSDVAQSFELTARQLRSAGYDVATVNNVPVQTPIDQLSS